MSNRAETGPMQFGDDWRGLFIRGDNALGFGLALKHVVDLAVSATDEPDHFMVLQVQRLLRLLGEARHGESVDDLQRMKPFGEAVVESTDVA